MALFRKRRRRDPEQQEPAPAPRAESGPNYAMVRSSQTHAVNGLWFQDPRQAQSSGLVEAVLAENELWDLVSANRRLVANTFDRNGGVFVMFGGALAPGEQPGPEQRQPPPAPTGEVLEVNGARYPVHSDFDAFARDAAAGRISLLRTTIAGLSMDDQSRLFDVLARTFGPDAPETRAIVYTGFYCMSCFHRYSTARLMNRDHLRSGGASNVADITACTECGGQDAVWLYDPSLRGQ